MSVLRIAGVPAQERCPGAYAKSLRLWGRDRPGDDFSRPHIQSPGPARPAPGADPARAVEWRRWKRQKAVTSRHPRARSSSGRLVNLGPLGMEGVTISALEAEAAALREARDRER